MAIVAASAGSCNGTFCLSVSVVFHSGAEEGVRV